MLTSIDNSSIIPENLTFKDVLGQSEQRTVFFNEHPQSVDDMANMSMNLTSRKELVLDFKENSKGHRYTDQIPCKHKIIANLTHLENDDNTQVYLDYVSHVLDSQVNMLKFSLSKFDNKTFEKVKNSVEKVKNLMREKNQSLPIAISLDYMVNRLNNKTIESFKSGEIVTFRLKTMPEKDRQGKVFKINNYDYVISNKPSPGDIIKIDFGNAEFLITSVHFVNGTVKILDESISSCLSHFIHRGESEEEELKDVFCFKDEDQLEEEIMKSLESVIKPNKNELIEKKFIEEDEDIVYLEAQALYDCSIRPKRPVQISKKNKNEKFKYLPESYFSYLKKIIQEVDLDYLVIDYVAEENYKFIKSLIDNRDIPIITKISDLNELKLFNTICQNSIAVILSFNFFMKDLSALEVILITENLVKIFKRQGLAVFAHSQTLESLQKVNKPLSSDLSDITFFLQVGIDGFNFGSSSFLKKTTTFNTMAILRDVFTQFMHTSKPFIKQKIKIGKSTDDSKQDVNESGSFSLYNLIRHNDHINLILLSNDQDFISELLSYKFSNNIILVTDSIQIIKRFSLYALNHIIKVDKIESSGDDLVHDSEMELVNNIKKDKIISILVGVTQCLNLFVKRCVGDNFEFFFLYNQSYYLDEN